MDYSADMIAQARAAYADITFVQGDAADFHFDQPFDAVFSNAALHWVLTPQRVIACVRDALKPGGRFVAEFGGRGNVAEFVASVHDALRDLGYPVPENAWDFPGAGEYATWLEEHGFRVAYMTHFDRPTPLKGEDAIPHYLQMYVPQNLKASHRRSARPMSSASRSVAAHSLPGWPVGFPIRPPASAGPQTSGMM